MSSRIDTFDAYALAFITFVVGFIIGIVGMALTEPEATCEEYGTVPIVSDGEVFCVPWEDAPNLTEFPQGEMK